MPQFKETSAIFTDEKTNIFDKDWDIVNKPAFFPPNSDWDYQRDMMIEDVNIWEVILEQSNGPSLYAAWDPYAEFYLIRYDKDWDNPNVDWQQNVLDGKRNFDYETHYGNGANITIQKRLDELGIKYMLQQHWVEPEDMWTYV